MDLDEQQLVSFYQNTLEQPNQSYHLLHYDALDSPLTSRGPVLLSVGTIRALLHFLERVSLRTVLRGRLLLDNQSNRQQINLARNVLQNQHLQRLQFSGIYTPGTPLMIETVSSIGALKTTIQSVGSFTLTYSGQEGNAIPGNAHVRNGQRRNWLGSRRGCIPREIIDNKSLIDSETSMKLDENPSSFDETWVDTMDGLRAFLPNLDKLKRGVAELSCDCEGGKTELGRRGCVTFFAVTIISLNHSWVFDTHKLGRRVFEEQSTRGNSLRCILQSADILQLWFDVRSDWNALFFLYNIAPGWIHDVQFVEVLCRYEDRRHLKSLLNCMKDYGGKFLNEKDLSEWVQAKEKGKTYFQANGWGCLEQRPLSPVAKKYVGGDTKFLGQLYNLLMERIEPFSKAMWVPPESLVAVLEERTRIRLDDATTPEFWAGQAGCTPPAVFQDMMPIHDPGDENWVPPVRTPEEQAELDRAFGIFQ